MSARYNPGIACPRCGQHTWSIGRMTAECLTPRCGVVMLLPNKTGNSGDIIRHGSNPKGVGVRR